MIFNSVMKSIKNFCKDDDTCIFVILVLIGFLLCMFFNKYEGFADYQFDQDNSGNESGDSNTREPSGIGREPTKHASIEETIEPPGDPQMPQIAKPEKLPGMMPQDPGTPGNVNGLTKRSIDMARSGPQYNSELLPNTGGINVIGFSLDRGVMGVPLEYSFYTPLSRYKGDGQGMRPSSDLGPQFPNGGPPIPQVPQVNAMVGVESVDANKVLSTDTGVSKKEMELVLFYAPWCGHSKNMLGDFDSVMNQYNNKVMNNVTLSIIKVDMDADKEGAKPYGVDIKGFPTLYTFIEENGKLVSQPFSPRDEKGIVEELQKRTQSLGSQ